MARARKRGWLAENPNVLVVETGLVGELLIATPALRALRKARPGARVTALVSTGSAPVLVGNPAVNRILPMPRPQRTGLIGLVALSGWMQTQRFDAALLLHTSFRSALSAALAGIPVRAGLSSEGRGFLLTRRAKRDRGAYEVDEHLKALALLGVPADGRSLELHPLDADRAEAAKLLGPATPGQALVGLHPGASREIRRWPTERFAELGARLLASGVEPVFVVGPREGALADAVAAWWRGRSLPEPRIVRPASVRILGALFQSMDVVVTNNTGPMHVAAAVGVRGVFIHGPTPVARWQPPGERWVAIFAPEVACRPCDSPTCRLGRLACMEAVAVDRVEEAVAGLLEAARPGGPPCDA